MEWSKKTEIHVFAHASCLANAVAACPDEKCAIAICKIEDCSYDLCVNTDVEAVGHSDLRATGNVLSNTDIRLRMEGSVRVSHFSERSRNTFNNEEHAGSCC